MADQRFFRALVVGKFAPLHRGHVLLIDRASEAAREVVILSYADPEPVGCEASRRERWLRTLYPKALVLVATSEQVEQWLPRASGFSRIPPDSAPEDTHRRFCATLLRDHLGVCVHAVFSSERYGPGLARVLTEEQRLRWPEAVPVVAVTVDLERTQVPIRATAIRQDVHAHREWLPREVYGDFVERVCLLGAESTGKSTLAEHLARSLRTLHVREYGRKLWQLRGGALRQEDFARIVRVQTRLEDAACRDRRVRRFVVCDTSPLTTHFYQQELGFGADPAVTTAAERTYAHTFLCAPDFPLVQDGTRGDEAFRARQQAWYEAELASRGIVHTVLRGCVSKRLAAARAALGLPVGDPGSSVQT